MSPDEVEILSSYQALKPHLNIWGSKVDAILKEEVEIFFNNYSSIKIPPKFRLKDDTSFIKKALYIPKSSKYKNPLLDIEDKVATRIVLLTSDDVQLVSKHLLSLNNNRWHAKLTKDAISLTTPKEALSFGYQSIHIVVTPITFDGVEINELEKLSCEIQVRTLLQHAFAEVSHDSTYKGAYENDIQMIRNLSKAMALMEATDDYFCQIFNQLSDNTSKYNKYLDIMISKLSNININFKKETMSTYLNSEALKLIDELSISESDLISFCDENDALLRQTLLYKDNLNKNIFNQPIIILLSYLVMKKPNKLRSNCDLDNDILGLVFRAYNKSFDT